MPGLFPFQLQGCNDPIRLFSILARSLQFHFILIFLIDKIGTYPILQ